MAQGWIKLNNSSLLTPFLLPFPLDPGETAAIALAMEIKADILLIDERKGREAARRNGVSVGGILGELLYAKNVGWIPSVKIEIEKLRKEAGFFVDSEIERFILFHAGE